MFSAKFCEILRNFGALLAVKLSVHAPVQSSPRYYP